MLAEIEATDGTRTGASGNSNQSGNGPHCAGVCSSNPGTKAAPGGFWIAGLSLLNTIVALSGGEWGFIFGLAVTQVVDEIAKMAGGGVAAVAALVVDVFIAGVLVLLGVFARKGHVWAYWVGMVLYAMDGLVSLFASFWLGLAFHAFALFSIYQGLAAHQQLRALGSAAGAQAAQTRTIG